MTFQNILFRKEKALKPLRLKGFHWLREQDLNLRSSGYEPDEIPDFSIPRFMYRPCGQGSNSNDLSEIFTSTFMNIYFHRFEISKT